MNRGDRNVASVHILRSDRMTNNFETGDISSQIEHNCYKLRELAEKIHEIASSIEFEASRNLEAILKNHHSVLSLDKFHEYKQKLNNQLKEIYECNRIDSLLWDIQKLEDKKEKKELERIFKTQSEWF